MPESVDELLVYDNKQEEYVTLENIPINEKDRKVLSVLSDSDLVDEDGFVLITDLKKYTDMSRKDVDYRFRKFGEERYENILDLERVSPPGKTYNARKARLTEKGKKLIRRGLIGEKKDFHKEVVLTKGEYEELQADIESLEREVDVLSETVEEQQSSISSLNSWVGDLSDDIQDLFNWQKSLRSFILGVRKAFASSGISLDTNIKEAKKELKQKDMSSSSEDNTASSSVSEHRNRT